MSNQGEGTGVPTKPDKTQSGSGRGHNRFNRNQRGFNNSNRLQVSRFEGREPSLKGFIYDITGERNPDQYIKTTKEIINFVGRTYSKYKTEFITAVTNLELDDPEPPPNPDPNNQILFEIWKLDIKEYREKAKEYSNFRSGLYNTVFGQCTEALQDKLKSHQDFHAADQDGIELLSLIKELTYTFEERSKLSDALCDVKENFYTFRQGRTMSLQRYHELFLSQVEVLEQVGVTVEDESLVESIAVNNMRAVPNADDRAAAREQALAIRFIRGTNDRYKSYLVHLRNSFLDGNDVYPTTLHQAYNILQRRELDVITTEQHSDGLAFANVGSENNKNDNNAGNDNKKDHIICYDCGEKGHYANKCPKRIQESNEENNNKNNTNNNQQGNNMCTVGEENKTDTNGEYVFHQSAGSNIPEHWILLDNQSTIDIFRNRALLSNIRESTGTMTVHCNAGSRTTNLVGDLAGYGTVWYDPLAIANILSLKRVRDKYHVLYDSADRGTFLVIKPDGQTLEFAESDRGLYYLDAKDYNYKEGTLLVNTTEERKGLYSYMMLTNSNSR